MLTALSGRGTGKGKQGCQESGSRVGAHKRARGAGGSRGGAVAWSPVPSGPGHPSGCLGLLFCRGICRAHRVSSMGLFSGETPLSENNPM